MKFYDRIKIDYENASEVNYVKNYCNQCGEFES